MSAPRPYTLIAELTHRCPLRCPYCSNPLDLDAHRAELTTEEWCRAFEDAAKLGVVQLHLTGGEPLARKDLEPLVAKGRALDLYVNLITSGVPLRRERLEAIAKAGLDAIQLSVQDIDAARSDRIAGYACFEEKMRVAAWARELDLPLTLNVVLHRDNIERTAEIVALGERLGAHRVELANVQYLGWALPNRAALLPSEAQIQQARQIAAAEKKRLEGKVELLFVVADHYAAYPRACMDGWARRFIHMVPDGTVLPCHAAMSIPGLKFESVRGRSLEEIWRDSAGLNEFRGDEWMSEPCKSCSRKTVDFGGCRCQAYALTGDAAATDPACSLSPRHGIIEEARLVAGSGGGRATSAPSATGTDERRYLYRGGATRG
jgi:pyrroloquinoline quinone biosynthesis protein E